MSRRESGRPAALARGGALAAVAALALAAAALAPGSAEAQLFIDDFEIASVHLGTTGPPLVQAYAVPTPGHCIAGVRTVALAPYVAGATASTVDLYAGSAVDDRIEIRFGAGGGEFALAYVPLAPVDITEGGLNDSLDVFLLNQTLGGTVEVQLQDQPGGSSSASMPTGGPIRFGLDAFPGALDLTQVTRVNVFIRNNGTSSYDMPWIRMMGNGASFQKLDASAAPAIGPPYPTSPVIFQVSDNNGPVEEMAITLADALSIGGTQIGMSLQGEDSGGGVGTFGEVGLLGAMWDGAGAWEDGGFVLPVDTHGLGIDPEPFLPMLPAVTMTSTGFLLSFDVWYPGGGGGIVSVARRQMMFDVPAGQAVTAINPCTLPPATARAGRAAGYSGFVLEFDLEATGAVDAGVPLFEVTITGDCAPGSPTDAPAIAPATAGLPALSARPNVTRSGTELLLASPARMDARIDLFDVTGRLVRRLGLAAGASSAAWDGRSGDGARVPAGVYFARVASAGPGGTARVVVVR